MSGTRNDAGAWGTATTPLLMSPLGWAQLHPFLKARMTHVHLLYGQPDDVKCVKHRYDKPCWGGQQVPVGTTDQVDA